MVNIGFWINIPKLSVWADVLAGAELSFMGVSGVRGGLELRENTQANFVYRVVDLETIIVYSQFFSKRNQGYNNRKKKILKVIIFILKFVLYIQFVLILRYL